MFQESSLSVLSPTSSSAIRVASARGSWLTDHTGRDYLDFVQGNAVNTLGHAPEAIHLSLKDQARRLLYCDPRFYNEPMLELAQRLTKLAGLARISFSGSAGEANENAIRLARQWGATRKAGQIISTRLSFPGRSEADSLQGQPGVIKVPYNDLAAVENAINAQTIAVLVEPIDGESGLSLPAPFYLRGLRRLTQDHGILLIVDETRSGIARTGKLFAFQDDEILPDILTLSRGLGAGLPLAATLVRKEFGSDLGGSGLHGGGHSLSMSAALAVLDTVSQAGFLEEVRATGRHLQKGLQRLACYHHLGQVRGRGLLCAIQIPDGLAQSLAAAALAEGLIIDAPRADWLRLMPALNVSYAEVDEMLVRLACALNRRPST